MDWILPLGSSHFLQKSKKTVYIEGTDEALGRTEVVFLANDGSALQQEHFGSDALCQIRQKMLKHRHSGDVSASCTKARARLSLISDKDYDRSDILIEVAKRHPADLADLDKTTVSGKSRTGTKSKREPVLVLELKDKTNTTVWELGISEGASHAHKNYRKKNTKGLMRIGLRLKDALDLIQDKYGVDNAILVGYQVIVQTMSIYLMRRCGNTYVMVHVHDVLIPDSMRDLAIIGAEYKIWFKLALTVENSIKPMLSAEEKGKVVAVHPPLGAGKARFPTVPTPELNKLLKCM
ncbi:hypothetical protein BG015_008888 [Linnemannia schmuckeri]|uniref:Uncharacterized protein n=1 Tax=Linnemannia schmuckeri TaxID=64567 RepID=A0A9P5RZW1_9FUNG|nr:hypothetical protein BG015_008888 [Linnemannia schmuckeri]